MKILKPKLTAGFTLIEVIIVIIIISILSTIVFVSLNSYKQKAETARILSDMGALSKSFELYHIDKGIYPYDDNSLGNYANETDAVSFLKGKLVDSKYIPVIPQFSNNDEYSYYMGQDITTGFHCGDKEIKDYIFIFGNENLDLDFPEVSVKNSIIPGSYCIGE